MDSEDKNDEIEFTQVFFIFFFGLAFIAAIIGYFENKEESNNLKIEYGSTKGKMKFPGFSYGVWSKNSGDIKFKFKVNQREYKGNVNKNKFCESWGFKTRLEIERYEFPIIYDKKNPNINRMLLKTEDFEFYKYGIPENIKCEILKYFDCKEYSKENYKKMKNKYCLQQSIYGK